MLPERRITRLYQNAVSSLASNDPLKARGYLTDALAISPYDPDLWYQRAVSHQKLGYPELAVGDAYRTLLLIEELQDAHDGSEFGFDGLRAWRWRKEGDNGSGDQDGDRGEWNSDDISINAEQEAGEDQQVDDDEPPELSPEESIKLKDLDLSSRITICRSLIEIGCLLDALEQVDVALKTYPSNDLLASLRQSISTRIETKESSDPELLREGHVARVIYPWNTYEPDRTSQATVDYLNTILSKASHGNFEARVTELPKLVPDYVSPAELTGLVAQNGVGGAQIARMHVETTRQLGVYATKDLPANTEVFSERSIYTVNNRLLDPLCDCCNGPLDSNNRENNFSCPECDEVTFCSELCRDEALEMYHPALCGRDIDFLFKTAHTANPVQIVANDASVTATTSTPTKALYTLLLLRTLAMALVQDVNPLELTTVRYLYGSSPPPPPPDRPPTLPFTFSDNILSVFHILTRLEVDPYKVSLHTFDIWHTLTIHSKILGTASARHNLISGKPEVAALHLCYSLVNHDCEPSLMWECQSEMKFTTLRDVKTGDEVRDCYTDPRIESWKKRREWLLGSLGGGCRCGRCVRESLADP